MSNIKKAAIEKFMGPIAEDHLDLKVSLFVVSSKNKRLKKLNLENLAPEERSKKLHQWGQEHRFVLVIEKGDMVFAHTHNKHAEQLQGIEGLSLNGKNVAVKALTDEEAGRLSKVGEAFEENVLEEVEEEKEEGKVEEKRKAESHLTRTPVRQYFAEKQLVSDEMYSHHLIESLVRNNLGKIIIRTLQQFNEARREEEKRRAADEKYFGIKRNEIKKEILKDEIKKEEVERQENKGRVIAADGSRRGRSSKR
jgi:hypothetical protein